jgi:hypothetical protein
VVLLCLHLASGLFLEARTPDGGRSEAAEDTVVPQYSCFPWIFNPGM